MLVFGNNFPHTGVVKVIVHILIQLRFIVVILLVLARPRGIFFIIFCS